jgi:hypothetical protein
MDPAGASPDMRRTRDVENVQASVPDSLSPAGPGSGSTRRTASCHIKRVRWGAFVDRSGGIHAVFP